MSVTSSQIITSIVKEEPAPLSPGALSMNLKCDYCRRRRERARPYIIAPRHLTLLLLLQDLQKGLSRRARSRLAKTQRKLEGM